MSREDDSLLEDLVARWQDLRDHGKEVGPEELCAGREDLREPLQRRLQAILRMEAMLVAAGQTPESEEEPAQEISGAQAALPEAESLPQIAGYHVEGVVGRGGMGVVYRATQRGLKRTVAIKMLRGEALGNAEVVRRFQAEAEAAALLQHPHIVQIYEVGRCAAGPYLALEFVSGPSLDQRVREGPLPPRQAAQWLEVVARAMQAAHDRHLVHRDLKPSNILLDPHGTPKVTDFGLAKRLDADLGHTLGGDVLGTPSYMAPEQAAGMVGAIGPLADVYALGAVLYELLAGRPPFRGSSVWETVHQVRTQEPPPPSRFRAAIHRDLETICLKCLDKSPPRRYPSAADLADDLRRFLDGEPIMARAAGRLERTWRWAGRQPAIAALLVLCAAAFLVGGPLLAWNRWQLRVAQRDAATSARLTELAQRAERLARDQARQQEYSALVDRVRERNRRRPTGWTWQGLDDLRQALQLAGTQGERRALREEVLRCLAGFDLRPRRELAIPFPVHALAYAGNGSTLAVADGRAAAFSLPCQVLLLDAETLQTRQRLAFEPELLRETGRLIPRPDGARSLALTADGVQVAAGTRGGQVHLWQGKNAERPSRSWRAHGTQVVDWVAFAPQPGELWTAATPAGNLGRWRVPAEPGDPVEALARRQFPESIRALALHPDGTTLALALAERVVLLDARTFQDRGTVIPGTVSDLQFSSDGRHLVVCEPRQLALLDLEANRRLPLFLHHAQAEVAVRGVSRLVCHPSGGGLVAINDDEEDRRLLPVEIAAGYSGMSIPLGGTGPIAAAFRGDGRELAVATDRRLVVYEVSPRLEESGPPALAGVAAGGATDAGSWWALAADGGAADSGAADSGAEVRLIEYAESETPRQIRRLALAELGSSWAVHPREPWVAFTTDGAVEFFGAAGRAPRSLTADSPSFVRFAPDGQRLFVVARETEVQAWEWRERRRAWTWSNAAAAVLTGQPQIYALAAGRHWIAAGGRDGVVRLLAADTGACEHLFPGPRFPVRCLDVAAADQWLACGQQNGEVRVVEIPGGTEAARFLDHQDQVTALDFDDAGRWLVTAARDGTCLVYSRQAAGWEQVLRLPTAPGPICYARFSTGPEPRLMLLVAGESAPRSLRLRRLSDRLRALGDPDIFEELSVAPSDPLPPTPSDPHASRSD